MTKTKLKELKKKINQLSKIEGTFVSVNSINSKLYGNFTLEDLELIVDYMKGLNAKV